MQRRSGTEFIPYGRLRPGPGFQIGRAALYYTHRVVPFIAIRNLVANAVASRINRTDPTQTVLTGSHQQRVDMLDEHGITIPKAMLLPTEVAVIRSFLDEEPISRSVSSAHYTLNSVLHCPYLLALANNPSVIQTVTAYLGCRPTISQIGLRWTYPVTSPVRDFSQQFHRDYDDWRSVKLFVFLSDVDSMSGPHVFVAGSHRRSGRFRCGSYYTPQQIQREYGEDSIRRIMGPSGSGFFADTFGIHKGEVSTSRPRLLFSVQYSLLQNFSLDYRPVSVPGADAFDSYINRLLVTFAPELHHVRLLTQL